VNIGPPASVEPTLYRLGQWVDGAWVRLSHPAVFRIERPDRGAPRLVGGVPASDPAVLAALATAMTAPLRLLFVLHTPRGVGAAGRYESPVLSQAQVAGFLERFKPLLAADGRFDLWLHSSTDDATVVWDRHDRLFAYGPVDRFAAVLDRLGFANGDASVSSPHAHNYHSELDATAREVLEWCAWTLKPLRPEDEQ
jgi:hypothetical protein